MSAALLVVDVQESFRHMPYWREDDVPAYLMAQNQLIAAVRAAGMPVVRVFHEEAEGPFSAASGLLRPLAGSDGAADHTVLKRAHSAMIGTGLPEWLAERGIDRLVVSGMRTEKCCETTTRHACDLGFRVDYVTEATLTFPMPHVNGRVFSPAEIKERTELVLARGFATICSVDQLVDALAIAA
jgi:nicotinamidase-related amidase